MLKRKGLKFNKKKATPLRFLILTVIFQLIIQLAVSQFLPKINTQQLSQNINDNTVILSHGGGHQAPVGSPEFWEAIIVSTICVIGAGFCSGLTVGYLSIEELDLLICIQGGGSEKEIKMAQNVLPIIRKHHLLLSTLLVANALCMETLPIYLHVIFPAIYAVLFSTIFVVLFGEIIPQAFCTGPSQLIIANFCVPLIKILIAVFYIICKPTALLLDYILGVDHKFLFGKSDLKALINIHFIDGVFEQDQYLLMQSLFDLRTDPVSKQMVSFNKVYCVDRNTVITKEFIKQMKSYGYSQVPVYDKDRQNIRYVMKTKQLLMCQEHSNIIGQKIKDRFKTQELLTVKKSSSMLDLLIAFQKTKTTFALIVDEIEIKSRQRPQNQYLSGVQSHRNDQGDRPKIIGIITLKDIFEEILDQQLMDEDFHKGQMIEIERLKEEKKKIKEEKQKMQENIEQAYKDENEELIKEMQSLEDKLTSLKKELKSKKKQSKKQKGLIDDQKLKELRQQKSTLKNDNELVEKPIKKGKDLEEPLIRERKGSF